jgi:hypothetical protein
MTQRSRSWRIIRLLVVLVLTAAASSGPMAGCAKKDATGACCKVCRTGKACGDTCIDASLTCQVPGGCACNG